MVFVAVGDEKGADLAAVGLEIGIVRDDVVDAREIGFGEADAGIDDDEYMFFPTSERPPRAKIFTGESILAMKPP